jgi:chromosome segregation ATPase
MEVVLGILLVAAVIVAIVAGLQVGPARSASARAQAELTSLRTRHSTLESEAKKSADALEAKRREVEDLKQRLRDAKKRRYEEREASRQKKDLEDARAEIEREMQHKLALAREDAEQARAALKKATAELEALRGRRPAKAEVPAVEKQAEAPAGPPKPREATPEEKQRAENAEKALAKARQRIEELEAEVKKARGRSETDRRVFLVQKSEAELARDKFRALESRFNALTLERDELAKALFTLEKEMKSLRPTAEAEAPTAASKPEAPAPAAAQAPAPASASVGEKALVPAGEAAEKKEPAQAEAQVEGKPESAEA